MCFRRNVDFVPKKYKDRKIVFYSAEEIKEDKSKKYACAYTFIVNKDAPLFIVIPGGAYRCVCMGKEGTDFAEELNKKGYNAVVLWYRVFPYASAPNPQTDVASLIKYLFSHKAELGFENEKYGVIGFSAGGHLAGSFSTKNVGYEKFGLPAPCSAILAYPVIVMGKYTHDSSLRALTGGEKDLAEAYSVENHVGKDYPATYVWCCKDDNCVPPYNSEILYQKLTEVGVPCVLREFAKGGHGLGLGKGSEADGWFDEAVEFAKKYF